MHVNFAGHTNLGFFHELFCEDNRKIMSRNYSSNVAMSIQLYLIAPLLIMPSPIAIVAASSQLQSLDPPIDIPYNVVLAVWTAGPC